ncbi:MAG: monofunctional biosynthetic peptidoglycan transglycosylase [Betaproteobacteria bacterium]|nr:monofunctional biosynthetic peptidoglycan transglycosylase [Betaproteobacteria bacterium]
MNILRKWLKRTILALLLLALLWQGWYLGWVVWWKYADPGMTHFMQLRLDEMQLKNPKAQLKHQWQPYQRISVHLKRAVIAAEDDKFIDHEGFDWEGMQKALEKNRRKGRVVAGGSTISQQLAKNLFLSASKTPWRKAQEAVITLMLETLWDKRRILEVYLNSVEWGEGIFGAEAAARHYYNASAAQLSAEQAARLAVMLPAPRRFQKNPYSAFVNERTQIILGRMQDAEAP